MTSAVIAGFVVGGIMQSLLGWLLLRDVVDDQTGLSAAGVARTLGTMIRSMVRTEGGFKLVTEQPTTLAELKDRYAIAKGSLEVNLEQLALPVGTTHVQAHVDAGALTVVVPRGVAVQAHEEAGDGTLGIFDRTVTGTNVRQDFTDEDYSQAALRLALDLSVGSGVLNVVRTG
jgi:hypothetical protein